MVQSTQLYIAISILLGVLVITLLAIAMWRKTPSRRREQLREKFGPEYDVAVERYGLTRAQRVLEERTSRVRKLPLRSLSPSECATFSQSWRHRQEQFVDTPSAAVSGAHELVQRVMLARGYPVEDFEQSVADLSVDYGAIVTHYRAAHKLEHANRSDQTDTEALRQAMVHYRALFEELLGTGDAQPVNQVVNADAPLSERSRELRLREQRPQA